MTRARRLAWFATAAVCAGLGVLLVTGLLGGPGARGGVARAADRAGSTPVRILTPDPASPALPADAPVIVLAHGFAGSAAMMDPMASALARAGFTVVVPDLPGHGTNLAPLDDASLDAAIDQSVARAGELTGRPVVLVGHSMGAGAVTGWAAAHPRARATVAISLPSAQDLPADAGRPANLLLLWGSAEQARFVDAALEGLRLGYPQGQAGPEYGDRAAGTARRAQQIAGAEHISVIYRQQTFDEVASWLAPAGSAPAPAGDLRVPGLLLVLLGGLLATRPILATGSRATSPPVGPSAGTAPPAGGRALLGFVLAAVGGGLGAAVLTGLTERVPVAVAGYLLAWFACAALVLALAAGARPPAGTTRGALRGIAAGVVLCVAMALPARVTWAGYHLAGARIGVFVALLLVLGAWFHGESRLVSGAGGWRRAGLLASSRVLVVVGLLGAVLVLGAPGFLTLTVPLVVPILALLAVVSGWSRDPLAAAAAQALPLALVVATTFPILA